MKIFLYFAKYQAQHITYSILTNVKDFAPYDEFVPPNVKIIPTTITDITTAVNTFHPAGPEEPNITISDGYKVCDYRVLFCELFGDIIEAGVPVVSTPGTIDNVSRLLNANRAPFTHWGWGDMDNIFGNVASPVLFPASGAAITRDVLAADNVHLTNGPFSVLRYNRNTCEMYKNIPKFWEMLRAVKTQFLEEKSLVTAINQQSSVGRVSVFKPPRSLECGDEVIWYAGTLFDTKAHMECFYFHFGGGHGRRMRVVGLPLMAAFDDYVALGYHRSENVGLIGNYRHRNYFFQVDGNSVTLLPGGHLGVNASKGQSEFFLGSFMANTVAPFLEHVRKNGGRYG